MIRRFFPIVLALLLLSGPALAQPVPASPRPRLAALATDDVIVLDGRLDEPAWQRAAVADRFTQREPDPGAPASERTAVRVIYTARTLYFGIEAFDREPEMIIAREMQRDGPLGRDDSVIILLDTFDDDRNAYFFETNPNGARTDSLITDEGRDTNFEWDGVWDARARRTAEGWVAEIAIPFSTLGFDPGSDTWGFNVRRLIRHKNEQVYWAPIGIDANLFRVSLYGELSGIEGASAGLDLDVKPFVVASDASAREPSTVNADSELDLGLDAKWGLARGWSLDLTLNTDFAETEVDSQEINLTRFSLFFPEKREFFLENAGIFEFGPDEGGSPLLEVFFSRRIGIGEDGREVPIDGGARLTGRAGPWNVGLLGVLTEAVDGDAASVPRNTWGAARLKRNVGERSSVGLIFTDREGEGGDHNRVFGADFDWKPSDRLAVAGFWTRSDDSDLSSGDDWAGGVAAEWDGSIWSGNVGYTEIGERFEPEMGFLRRRGIRRYTGEVEYEPRPPNERIRNYSFELETEVITTRDGTTESSEIQLEPFGVRLESEDRFIVFVERNFERLFEPFEIVDGVVIPVGEYSFYDFGLFVDSNSSRRVTFEGSLRWSGFFDGDRFRSNLTLGYRPNRFVRSELTWEHNDIELPWGSFTTNVVRERLGLALNPRLRADTFLQYNDLDENLALNLRVNWIYKPGADLFVVFNQNWDAPSFDDLERRDRQVIVKFTYLYQR